MTAFAFPCQITIDVTQKDIDNGIREDCVDCPIVLAARRATGREFVMVAESVIDLFVGGYREKNIVATAKMPRTAINFIADFDREKSVTPFTFTAEFVAVQP